MRLLFQNSNWLNTLSFKPVLFLGIASTSSVATFLTASHTDTSDKFRDIYVKTSKPLLPLVLKFSKGTNSLFGKLRNWARVIGNQGDSSFKAIKETKSIYELSDGIKKIIKELEKWGEKLYEILKKIIPSLNDWDEIQKSINKYGLILKNILNYITKAGIGGNELLLNQLLKATEKENFSDFLSATGELASKHPEVFKDMKGEELEDLVHAYNAEPEKTTQLLENFSKKSQGEANKDNLMEKVKEYALIERIEQAIQNAKRFTSKESLDESEKEEAKKAHKTLNELLEEVKKTLESHQRTK